MERLARLGLAGCCAAAVMLGGAPAAAHDRATARIDRPAEGAVLVGYETEVVLTAGPGGAAAEFRLLLDGRPLDEAGRIGSDALFTTFRLAPGASKRLVIAIAPPGRHTLRLEPTVHADRPEAPVVRSFTSRTPSGSPSEPLRTPTEGLRPVDDPNRLVVPVALGAGAAVAVGGLVWARRRRRQPAP